MAKNVAVVFALIAITLTSSCGTIYTLEKDEDRLLVYSGVRYDAENVAEACGCIESKSIYGGIMGIHGFFGFPFSLMLDTVMLPYTLLRELWRPHASTE